MDIAARTADVILLDDGSIEGAKARHGDLKSRVAASGRDPDAVKVLINVGVDVAVDSLDALFRSKSCDGFNVLMPPQLSALDDFVDRVLPELRRGGLFRQGYHGATLRSHLGLAGGDDR